MTSGLRLFHTSRATKKCPTHAEASVVNPGFFRDRGANPPAEGINIWLFPEFPKNCMKLKEFWPPGGGTHPSHPLIPHCLTACLDKTGLPLNPFAIGWRNDIPCLLSYSLLGSLLVRYVLSYTSFWVQTFLVVYNPVFFSKIRTFSSN